MNCIPQNEMVVLARDMNGHVGSNSNTMERMVVMGFEIGMPMAPGFWSLQMGR